MKREIRGPLTLFAAGVAVDQISKFLVQRFLENEVPIVGSFFRLSRAHNYGFSFSLGMGLPGWLQTALKVGVPLFVLGFVATQLFRRNVPKVQAYALASISAGALGNLIDRVFRGYVVDFLLFKMYGLLGFQYWPTFNVADTCLVLGSITFAVAEIFFTGREGREPAENT